MHLKREQVKEHINVAFEIKQTEESDGFFRFEGLASTFGNTDLVNDIVERGAFLKSIAAKLPIILWQHDMAEPIGMPEEIRETPDGLFIRGALPLEDDFVRGRVKPQMKVGSIRTMSIGFRVPKGGFEIDSDGVRRLKEIDLLEVSLVTFPANPQAMVTGFKAGNSITVKDLSFINSDINTAKKLEKALSESGLFSVNAAKKLVACLNSCESEADNTDNVENIKRLNSMVAKIEAADNKIALNNLLIKARG